MSPTPRAALLLGVLAATATVVPVPVVLLGLLALAAAVIVDAGAVRRPPVLDRRVPDVLSRGVPSDLRVEVLEGPASRLRLRQAAVPDVEVEPSEAEGGLSARIVARRRGRHELPPVAARAVGPLGLGAWYHGACTGSAELLVYPDLPAARRVAMAVRHGRFRDPGRASRGPLGLGTEFEQVRDYLPDDDVRQVNWLATARTGRPMSNQYRVEQDREVLCVLDTGRLMGAPVGDLTRLDAAVDAVTSLALVADEVGDRCGLVAFDAEVRRRLRSRRGGGDGVVRAIVDLEPTTADSDYELAFRTLGGAKRAFVCVFTDLVEETAARPLTEAIPLLVRRHAVAVASVTDPDLEAVLRRPPGAVREVYEQAAALDVLEARRGAVRSLRGVGADVLEAPPGRLGAACVRAYLRAKALARL